MGSGPSRMVSPWLGEAGMAWGGRVWRRGTGCSLGTMGCESGGRLSLGPRLGIQLGLAPFCLAVQVAGMPGWAGAQLEAGERERAPSPTGEPGCSV